MLKPKSVIRDFSCKKLDYSRLFHRYSIYILTQYASFTLFQDKMKAKFSNDRFGFKLTKVRIFTRSYNADNLTKK